MWLRTWMILWKEFKQISRDPRMLGITFGLPIVMLLVFGYAINFDVKHVKLAIFDQSHTAESRALYGAFFRNDYFDLAGYLQADGEVRRALDGGTAKAVLIIPPTYTRDLAAGRTASVQLLIDGSDSTAASTAIGYTNALLQQQALQIKMQALTRAGVRVSGAALPIDLRLRYWYNPELKSTTFTIPGLIAVILMMLATLLTSATVARERERGTFEQLAVSPIRPIEIMLGKLAPYVIIAFADVIFVVLAAILLFNIPFRGNYALLLLESVLFLTAGMGLGLLISTVAPSQQIAMMISLMATQLPSILLSGFVFPVRSMPMVIQWLSNVFPATHYIFALRTLFLKGGGMAELWPQTLFLFCFAVLMLVGSATRFKKKL